jgi:metal-responsive CopG/Arc/MetJ family transcriptional regulator
MKTAVSIPNDIYDSAEKLATHLGKSRSQLYAQALKNYMQEQNDEAITSKLNEIYSNIESSIDPGLKKLQTHAIPKEEW